MSFPIFNPRLELIRLLMQAIRGDDTTTLAAILAELDWLTDRAETFLPYLQNIHNTGLGLLYSDGNEGEPPAGTKYPSALYQLLTAWSEAFGTATANQAAADAAAVARLPKLTDIDLKFGNLGTYLGTVLEVTNRSDPLGTTVGDIANAVEALLTAATAQAEATIDLGEKLDTANGLLADLLECCQEGSDPSGPNPFPPGQCELYPMHWEVMHTGWLLGTYSSALPYGATDFIGAPVSGAAITIIGDVNFPQAFAITDPGPRQVCIAWNLNEGWEDKVFKVWRIIRTEAGEFDWFTPDFEEVLSIDPVGLQGSTSLVLDGPEDAGEGLTWWYVVLPVLPEGFVPVMPNIGLWVSWGGVG